MAQQQTVDKVVAVVGNEIVLQSDIESQYLEYLRQQNPANEAQKCKIMEDMIMQKMLVYQGEIDSLPVKESQVDQRIDQRIQYFTAQMGGNVERLEKELLGKTVLQFKNEIRPQVREQILAQAMQEKITENVKVSPIEVYNFYNKVPLDSLPLYNTEVEVGVIIKYPAVNKEQKNVAKTKLENLRARIKAGEDFATVALMYSQDPGSAVQGGDLGYFGRGMMVGPFEAMAFKIKPGEISPIIETKFGYHIIEVTDRRGEQLRARHILIKPEFSQKEVKKAQMVIDSAMTQVKDSTLTFAEAASKYSDDTNTRSSGGLLRNPEQGGNLIPVSLLGQIDANIAKIIDTMEVGHISEPEIYFNPNDGQQGFRIIYLKNRIDAHRANLTQDYIRIQEAALQEKKVEEYNKWVSEKSKEFYIKVDSSYHHCSEVHEFIQAPLEKKEAPPKLTKEEEKQAKKKKNLTEEELLLLAARKEKDKEEAIALKAKNKKIREQQKIVKAEENAKKKASKAEDEARRKANEEKIALEVQEAYEKQLAEKKAKEAKLKAEKKAAKEAKKTPPSNDSEQPIDNSNTYSE